MLDDTRSPNLLAAYLVPILAMMLGLAVIFTKPALTMVIPFLGVCGLVVQGRQLFYTKTWPFMPTRLVVLVISLVALSTLWALVPIQSLLGAVRLAGLSLAGLGLIMLADHTRPSDTTRQIIALPLIIGFGFVVIGWIIGFGDYLYPWLSQHSTKLSNDYFNRAITVFTLMLPGMLAVLKLGDPVHRRLISTLLCGWFLMAIVSEAQSALLGGLVMMILYAIPDQARFIWRLCRGLLICGIITAPWIALYSFDLLAGNARAADFLSAAHIAERLELWHAVALKIFTSPWLGFGYDATAYIPHFDSKQIYLPGTKFRHPDNMALQIWIEYGVVGALLAAAMCRSIARSFDQMPLAEHRRMYRITFYGLLTVGVVGWGMWQAWWICLIFLLVAYLRIVARVIDVDQPHVVTAPNTPPATS